MARAEQGRAMPSVMLHASKILKEYGEAQSELIGKAVVLTDGKAGTVENIWPDELHGLRVSIEGHDGRWPVSPSSLRSPRPRIGCVLPRSRAPYRVFQSR
jgi:hypothetical protein